MNAERLLRHYERIADAPDAVPRLRRFILDLAVRGKLVSQDPKDEPASELLRRIEKEKARLVKAGEIKKSGVGPVGPDEEPFLVPHNWAWTCLGSIGDWGSGSTPPRGNSDLYGGHITWLKSGELSDNRQLAGSEETVTELAVATGSFRHHRPGDVLIAMYGATIGKVAILAECAVTNQAVCGCTPFAGVFNQFLFLFLLSQRAQFRSASEGGAQPNISKVKIVWTRFPLPPLAEQHRIVAKVDELMALCDRLEAARRLREEARDKLTAVSLIRLNASDSETFRDDARFVLEALAALTARPDQIKQLRHTIFNLAVRGKLVSQNPSDEPPTEQLQRLAAARRRLENDGMVRPLKANTGVDDPSFDIPSSWVWCRLPQIADVVDPNPSHRMPAYVEEGGLPFISSENFADGDMINFSLAKRVTQSTVTEQTNRFAILPGAFAFSRIGTIGKTRPLPQARDYAISHAVCVINPLSLKDISMRYLRLALAVDQILAHAHSGTRSIGVPDLGMGVIRTMAIPLPPLAEQHRIVAKVDALTALCYKLEANMNDTTTVRARLLETLLSEALNGRESLQHQKVHEIEVLA